MLLLSTTGMALGYGSLFLVHHPVPALGLFLAAGLFESAFHPTIAALVGDLHADEDLPHAYGLTRVVASVGGVIGPILGAAAVTLSLSGVFAAAGVLLVGAALTVLLAVPSDRVIGPETTETDTGEDAKEAYGALARILRDRRLALLVLGGSLLSITFTWWQADGLVLLQRLHPWTPPPTRPCSPSTPSRSSCSRSRSAAGPADTTPGACSSWAPRSKAWASRDSPPPDSDTPPSSQPFSSPPSE